jgi:hypothetical protein
MTAGLPHARRLTSHIPDPRISFYGVFPPWNIKGQFAMVGHIAIS